MIIKPIAAKKVLQLENVQIPDCYIPYIINQVKEFLYGIPNEQLPEGSLTEFRNKLIALYPFLKDLIQKCYEHTYNEALNILYYLPKVLGDKELNIVHNVELARQMFLRSHVYENNKEY